MSNTGGETMIHGFFVYHLDDDDLDELIDNDTTYLTKPILLAKYHTQKHATYTKDDDDGNKFKEALHEEKTNSTTTIDESFVSKFLAEDPPDPVATLSHLGGVKVVQGSTTADQAQQYQLVYGADSLNVCLVVVTSISYPPKYAIELLQEWYADMKRDVSDGLFVKARKQEEEEDESSSSDLTEQLRPIFTSLLAKYGVVEVLLQRQQQEQEQRAARERHHHQNAPFAFADQESETEHLTPFDIEQAHLGYIEQTQNLQRRVGRRKFIRRWTFRCCMLVVIVVIILPIVFIVLRQERTFEEQREEMAEEFEQEMEGSDIPFPEVFEEEEEGNRW